MAYSYVRYTGNGTTASYTFPFQYINSDHVQVRVNGVAAIFSFLNANTVTITPAPVAASVVEIKRVTPKDTVPVNFTDGSVLLERDLDLLALFDLYIAQESADAVENTITVDSIDRWDARFKRLGNLAPAEAPDEAVTLASLQYEYPAVETVAQYVSQINIVGSDLGVSTAQSSDLGSITEAAGTNPASGGSRIAVVADSIVDIQTVADNISAVQGAITSAASAAASGTAAAASAAAALSSKNDAAASQSAALTSKNAASTSESNAATSASSAATSASTATSQASAASGSASSAATSASNAGSSATQAASSASSAATSATNASSSASSAATSATNASNSASTATSQAAAASASATTASGSEASVATNASAAASSASSAATSATTASTAASTAITQASNAASSASSASTSATSASSSASAAAISSSDAAASAASAAAMLDNFDDRYLGPNTSAPTLDNDGNTLVSGALYFDTTSGKMRVYTGAGWVDASAAAQAALTKYKFVATSGQTTFSGTDTNGLTLSYLAGGAIIALNGLVLVGGGDDYTATDGASVVLTSGATTGDTLEVYAFASFSIASLDGVAIVDNTITGAKILDSAITADKLATTLDLGTVP